MTFREPRSHNHPALLELSKAKKLLYDMELAAAAVEQTWHVRGAQKAGLPISGGLTKGGQQKLNVKLSHSQWLIMSPLLPFGCHGVVDMCLNMCV